MLSTATGWIKGLNAVEQDVVVDMECLHIAFSFPIKKQRTVVKAGGTRAMQ
jgi:hypothetical protein